MSSSDDMKAKGTVHQCSAMALALVIRSKALPLLTDTQMVTEQASGW